MQVELRNALDEYVATYGNTIKVQNGNEDLFKFEIWVEKLHQLIKFWAALSRNNVQVVAAALLEWKNTNGGLNSEVCSWVSGRIILDVLKQVETKVGNGQVEKLLDVCLEQCHSTVKKLERRNSETTGFFTFKSMNSKPVACTGFELCVQTVWRKIIGVLSEKNLSLVIHRLENEINGIPKTASTAKFNFILNFRYVRLHIAKSTTLHLIITFLIAFQPSISSSNKMAVRVAAVQTLADILKAEIDESNNLNVLHQMKDVDWMNTLQSLHKLSRKLCNKRDLAASAWELCVATLCVGTDTLFYRCWKEDAQQLLRYHSQSKDENALLTIQYLVKQLMVRYQTSGNTMPATKDLMEIVNTIQAWCFTIPKQKNVERFYDNIVPPLVALTLHIASFNMSYVFQSHLVGLITEAEVVYDERRFIGLKALSKICQRINGKVPLADSTMPSLNKESFDNELCPIGPILAQIIIECNAIFGIDTILNNSRAVTRASGSIIKLSEYKQTLGLKTFCAALSCIPYCYDILGTYQGHIIEILSKCIVNAEPSVREEALLVHCKLSGNCSVFFSLCTIVARFALELRDEDYDAISQTIIVISKMFEKTKSFDDSPEYQSLMVLVESLCITQLCSSNLDLRASSIQLLGTIRQIRCQIESSITSVLDIIESCESSMAPQFSSAMKNKAVSVYSLAMDTSDSSAFRWAKCLSLLFGQVGLQCLEVAASSWNVINAKAFQLEPSLVNPGDYDISSIENVSRWARYAILASATAFPQKDSNVSQGKEATISNISIERMLKRICRFLSSGSYVQRKYAVLALGSVHPLSHRIMLECLIPLQAEAFAETSPEPIDTGSMSFLSPTSSSRRHSRVLKQRALKITSQMDSQWAIGRCYRMVLENAQPLSWKSKTIRTRTLQFLENMQIRLTDYQGKHNDNVSSLLAMMQQDFSAIVEMVVEQFSMHSTSDSICLAPEDRRNWFTTIHKWTSKKLRAAELVGVSMKDSIEYTKKMGDIFGALDNKNMAMMPCFWASNSSMTDATSTVGDSMKMQLLSFLLARTTFPTLANLLTGPTIDSTTFRQDSIVLSWIDKTFALKVDSNALLCQLQFYARKGLASLLHTSQSMLGICITKCLFKEVGKESHTIACQYIRVLAGSTSILKEGIGSYVKSLTHACLLHVANSDVQARQSAVELLDLILNTRPANSAKLFVGSVSLRSTDNAAISYQTTLRYLTIAACNLCDNVEELDHDFLVKVLQHIDFSERRMQDKMLHTISYWLSKLRLRNIDKPSCNAFMQALLSTTQKCLPTHQKSLQRCWTSLTVQRDLGNLDEVLCFVFDRDNFHLPTCKAIIWWVTQENLLHSMQTILKCMGTKNTEKQVQIVKRGSRAIMLLADVTCDILNNRPDFDQVKVNLLHVTLTLLYCSFHPTSVGSPKHDLPSISLSIPLRQHCLTVLRNVMYGDACTSALENLGDVIENNDDIIANALCCLDEITSLAVAHCSQLEKQQWCAECTQLFSSNVESPQIRLYARNCMQVYRLLESPFDVFVCLKLTSMINSSIDNVSINVLYLNQIIKTLQVMIQKMPPYQLILVPDLVWLCARILENNAIQSLHNCTRQLVNQIYLNPTFSTSSMQHILLARRPQQWNPSDPILHRAAMHGLYDPSTEPLSRTLLVHFLNSSHKYLTDDANASLLFNTIALLPYICRYLAKSDDANNDTSLTSTYMSPIALTLAYHFEQHNHFTLANLYHSIANGKISTLQAFLSPFAVHFIKILPSNLAPTIFNLLIQTLHGTTSWLLNPILQAIQQLASTANSTISANTVFHKHLLQLLKHQNDSTTWTHIVSILATSSPSLSLSSVNNQTVSNNSKEFIRQGSPNPEKFQPEATNPAEVNPKMELQIQPADSTNDKTKAAEMDNQRMKFENRNSKPQRPMISRWRNVS